MQSPLEEKLGHQSYDLADFLNAFFGATDEPDKSEDKALANATQKGTSILEKIFYTVITRFKFTVKKKQNHSSGYYALELLVNIMKKIDQEQKLAYLKTPLSQLLLKFNYYFDKLIDLAYQEFHQNETSLKVPDKVVFVALKTQRLLIIDFFCTMISVSVGHRRSVASVLNPRIIDIVVIWIREKFDNGFVMVALNHS